MRMTPVTLMPDGRVYFAMFERKGLLDNDADTVSITQIGMKVVQDLQGGDTVNVRYRQIEVSASFAAEHPYLTFVSHQPTNIDVKKLFWDVIHTTCNAYFLGRDVSSGSVQSGLQFECMDTQRNSLVSLMYEQESNEKIEYALRKITTETTLSSIVVPVDEFRKRKVFVMMYKTTNQVTVSSVGFVPWEINPGPTGYFSQWTVLLPRNLDQILPGFEIKSEPLPVTVLSSMLQEPVLKHHSDQLNDTLRKKFIPRIEAFMMAFHPRLGSRAAASIIGNDSAVIVLKEMLDTLDISF